MMVIVGVTCMCGYAVDDLPDEQAQAEAIVAGSNLYNIAVDAIRSEHACGETTYRMQLQESED